MIASPTPTTQIYDIDDVGGLEYLLSDQSGYDYDSEEKIVTPISGDTKSVDFGTHDQPRELKINTSLSPDKRRILIDFLRSYLKVFAWPYEDMPGLDPL